MSPCYVCSSEKRSTLEYRGVPLCGLCKPRGVLEDRAAPPVAVGERDCEPTQPGHLQEHHVARPWDPEDINGMTQAQWAAIGWHYSDGRWVYRGVP